MSNDSFPGEPQRPNASELVTNTTNPTLASGQAHVRFLDPETVAVAVHALAASPLVGDATEVHSVGPNPAVNNDADHGLVEETLHILDLHDVAEPPSDSSHRQNEEGMKDKKHVHMDMSPRPQAQVSEPSQEPSSKKVRR